MQKKKKNQRRNIREKLKTTYLFLEQTPLKTGVSSVCKINELLRQRIRISFHEKWKWEQNDFVFGHGSFDDKDNSEMCASTGFQSSLGQSAYPHKAGMLH